MQADGLAGTEGRLSEVAGVGGVSPLDGVGRVGDVGVRSQIGFAGAQVHAVGVALGGEGPVVI